MNDMLGDSTEALHDTTGWGLQAEMSEDEGHSDDDDDDDDAEQEEILVIRCSICERVAHQYLFHPKRPCT